MPTHGFWISGTMTIRMAEMMKVVMFTGCQLNNCLCVHIRLLLLLRFRDQCGTLIQAAWPVKLSSASERCENHNKKFSDFGKKPVSLLFNWATLGFDFEREEVVELVRGGGGGGAPWRYQFQTSNLWITDHWSVTLPDTRGGQGGGSALAGGVGSSTFYQNNGRECDCVSNDHFLCTKESCSMGIADPPGPSFKESAWS